MPGIEYIVVFMIAFSSGYEVGKHKNCGHQHIIVKHRPWYTLNIETCLHKHKHKCKHKHKRKWKKQRHKRLHWRW